MRPDYSAALAEFSRTLGSAQVLSADSERKSYEANVTGFQRRVAGVLKPGSTEDVVRVVQIANQFRTPLHPVSRGRNWGLGSRLPPRDDAFVVDLGRMDKIREVSEQHAYAVVEPGVTQRQMHEHLQREKLPLVLNVIGSSTDSSLVGNALERGVGYFASRADQITGLEVVLGNGTVVHTGCGHYASSRITHIYRHGIGPGMDGLFEQSNFGIVTSAGIGLMRWHDEHVSIIARIRTADDLPALMDGLASLRRRQVLHMVVHVGNRARTFHTLAPLVHEQLRKQGHAGPDVRKEAERWLEQEGFGPWSAVASLSGTAEQIRAASRVMKDTLSGVAELMFMTADRAARARRLLSRLRFLPVARRKLAILEAMDPIFGLSMGVPTDAAVRSVYWSAGLDPGADGGLLNPDESAAGMLYCLPMMPLDGGSARRAVELTEQAFARHGFAPLMTLNILDDRCLEGVISLPFRRDRPDETARAHACIHQLQEAFLREGFIPYRTGIDFMPQFVNEGDAFWQVVRDLKKVLDPNGIISPGRYNLV